jgi:acetyl esterase
VAGAPPALEVTAGHDPLSDEGRAYAQRLEGEGVRLRMTSLHLSDPIHRMLMQGRLVSTSNVVADFVGAAIGDATYHIPPTPPYA